MSRALDLSQTITITPKTTDDMTISENDLNALTVRYNNYSKNSGFMGSSDVSGSAIDELTDSQISEFLDGRRPAATIDYERELAEELTADEVRKFAYHIIEDATGNSAWLREFSKPEQIAMIAQGYTLAAAQKIIDLGHALPAVNSVNRQPAPKAPEQPEATPQPARTGGLEDIIADAVISRLNGKLEAQLDADEITRIAREAVADSPRLDLTVSNGDVEHNFDLTHSQFPTLLKWLAAGSHVYMVGEAGGGKSKAAEMAAEALDVPFYSISANPQSSKHDFLGYTDANGRYVGTQFYEAVKHGGVFMIDEIDAANPGILTVINAAADGNKYVSFPHEQVEKHPDFTIVTGANTYGTGASRQYVGRNPLDAATVDRFAMIEWLYDEDLERELAQNDDWVDTVQALRAAAAELSLRVVISPRASIGGAKALRAGLTRDEVLNARVFRGMDDDTRTKLTNRTGI